MRKLGLAFAFLLGLSGLAQAQMVQTFANPGGGATPLTPSTTGTTGAVSVTFPAVAGRFNYICGFVISSGGTTAALVVNATITGTASGTMNFAYVFVSSGQGLLGVALPGCITTPLLNTAITVNVPAGGAGTVVALSAWGYSQ